MGYDAHFGHGRKGDTKLMEKLARENGFLFKKMGPVMIGKRAASSSWVRELLMKGEIEKAQRCLGRPFSLFGKVVHGKGHGSHLGFPTANLDVHSEILLPSGVYIASGRFLKGSLMVSDTILGKRCLTPFLTGVMNYGKRPTYPKNETPRPILELHLLGFKGKVYGEMMEIALHRFLRPEKRFPSEEALKAQISLDVQEARLYYLKRSWKAS